MDPKRGVETHEQKLICRTKLPREASDGKA